jgi:putative FmdB family regulatory protein
MPLYEYQCESCSTRFERIQKFADPPIETCPSCGGPVRKLLSSPAIQFKGSGWYITDYARKTSGEPSSKPDGGDGSKPAESKPESKSDSKSDSKPDSSASKADAKSE